MERLPPYLSDADIDAVVARALDEDVGTGDVTTFATVPEEMNAQAALIAKEDGILAGSYVAGRVFSRLDPRADLRWKSDDGATIAAGDVLLEIRAAARSILTAERTALNLLQRMSGIATETHRVVEAVRPHKAQVLDTRKTAPGLRLLDKWAVALGGGANHRIGLFDMILIKENHIAAAGGIEAAVTTARQWCAEHEALQIEIEVRTLEELREVLRLGGVDIVLLDNMVRRTERGWDVSMLEKAIDMVSGRIRTEASGNVTLESVAAIASTGVDYISSGALTHSVKALDLTLLVRMKEEG